MGIEEEEVQSIGIENILNKNNSRKPPKYWERDSYPGIGGFKDFSKRQDQKRTSLHHIIVKILSIQSKERILNTKREKHQVTYKDKLIRINTDFLTEILKARKE
jgi:hypothetical protein